MFKKRSTAELLGNVEKTETANIPSNSPKKQKAKKQKEKQPFSFKKLIRNRTVMASLSIALAFILSFVLLPIVQGLASRSIDVVKVTRNVRPGDIISEENTALVKVGGFNLANDTILSKADAIGKYVKIEMVEGDILQSKKLSTEIVTDDTYLLNLPDGKLAMSIDVPSLSQNLSGKLRTGDVIRFFSLIDNTDGEQQAVSPAELQYVEVLAATNEDTIDIVNGAKIGTEDTEAKKIATLTVAVDTAQALALTTLDGNIHTALVYRGDNESKSEMLKQQSEYIGKIENNEVTQ